MANDQANVFVRKQPQPALADDQKNKFQRNRDAVNAQQRDTSLHDGRVQKREQNRAAWTRQNEGTKTASGTHLDGDLAKSRDAAEKSRISRANPVPPIIVDIHTLLAVVVFWRTNYPDGVSLYSNFEESDWNKEQLQRAVQFHIANGMPITPALAQAAFDSCREGGHLDVKKRRDRDGSIVRRRGESMSELPPVEFPRTIWNDERQANEQAAHERAVAAAEAETRKALGMNFEELQAAVRKNYKPQPPTTAPVGG
jgi:hypothetical protein